MTYVNKAELRRLAEAAIRLNIEGGRFLDQVLDDFQEQACPISVLSLLDECDRAELVINRECQAAESYRMQAVGLSRERDAALAELAEIKSSGWRNHSVKYARAEKCPQTLETAQAAWDRDQELIEEQRQQIAKDSRAINDLRQKLEACRKDVERFQWVSIEDQLPPSDGPYWCWHGREEPSVVQARVCIFIHRQSMFSDGSVTHWMPLVDAPPMSQEANHA